MAETPVSSIAENPELSSLAKSDLLPVAQPSGPIDPEAQAAVDGAQASLAENPLLSSSVSTTINSWTNRSPINPPSARYKHALAYDASSHKVILFGGAGSSGYLNDTWAYDYTSNTWTNRSPANPPSARGYHALAYNQAFHTVILFGGLSNSGFLNDTWAYDYFTNAWTNLNPANPPPARCYSALACEEGSFRMVLFGGYNGSYLNDTWAYYDFDNTWTNRNPSNPPPARSHHALACESDSSGVILFGGAGSSGYLNDTWAYDYDSNAWANRNPPNPPPARGYHALAFNWGERKIVLFGGWNGGNVLNDTWVYDYSANSWIHRISAVSPPARDAHALAFGGVSGVILFGGTDGNSYLNDTWAYSSVRLSYYLAEGWNMISVPLFLDDPRPDAVFPAGCPTFAWDAANNRYLGRSQITLAVGIGYWVKVPSAQTITLEGQLNEQVNTFPLFPGWNLIGTPYCQVVAWGSVNVIRGAEIKALDAAKAAGWIGPFYRWTGTRYDSLSGAGTFQPLAGYWMRVFVEGCAIVFPQP